MIAIVVSGGQDKGVDTGVAVHGRLEDERLIVLRAQHDPREFAPLYERYLDPVYRYCYRRLGTREAAEDATSQVFYKAMAGLGTFRHDSFRAWLFTIAHNVVTDVYRRGRPSQPLENVAEPTDTSLTPEELAVGADERRSLQEYMTHLSPDQRRVIELRLAGLTGPEIASVLDRKASAIKTLQFRAVSRLRQLMQVEVDARESYDTYG